MRPLLIIPAYNEAQNICRVVDGLIANYPEYDYLVVNDGSRDQTAALCRQHRYNLLDLPVNLGLAGAFQSGMRYAFLHDYDCVAQLDGDGQHDPASIAAMLKTMEETKADIVIGSRFVSEKKPFTFRMIGSRLISFMTLLTTGKTLTDPTSGLRLYNRRMIQKFAKNLNYGPEPDTIAYLIRTGAKVAQVQVSMNERTAGQSYLNLSRSVLYMLNMVVSIILFQFARKKEE